jgi:hypothetical protein
MWQWYAYFCMFLALTTAGRHSHLRVHDTSRCIYIHLCHISCKANPTHPQTRKVIFDTDSIPIRVDNCATASISNDLKDFEGPVTPVRGRVKGITGYTNNTTGMMRGTIAWKIEDDKGQIHLISLPGSYYVSNSTSCILLPQHWSQQAHNNRPQPCGTWCAMYDDEIILYWNQRKYRHCKFGYDWFFWSEVSRERRSY